MIPNQKLHKQKTVLVDMKSKMLKVLNSILRPLNKYLLLVRYK
jgi:hypothetical protein